MSDIDLAGLLADATMAGAYYVDAGGRGTLADAAQLLGQAFFAIDLRGCSDKAQVLERFASALDFPPWFGGNWDALADCLNDLSWRPAAGYVLWLDHALNWKQADATGFGVLLQLADEVAAAWAAQGIPFWLLVPTPPGQPSASD